MTDHILTFCLRRILSYANGGVPEDYVKKDHSIVFTHGHAPGPTWSEDEAPDDPTSLRLPIRIKRTDFATKLQSTHRLRYSTVYRIYHDVKACEFGEVHPKYKWPLMLQVRSYLSQMQSELQPLLSQARHQQTTQLCSSALRIIDNSESSEDEQEVSRGSSRGSGSEQVLAFSTRPVL